MIKRRFRVKVIANNIAQVQQAEFLFGLIRVSPWNAHLLPFYTISYMKMALSKNKSKTIKIVL